MRRAPLLVALVVASLNPAAAQPLTGRMSGTDFDSVSGRFLVGAAGHLVARVNPARTRSVFCDAQGQNVFDSVPPRPYLRGVYSRSSGTSMQLQAPFESRGSIVRWTGQRRVRPPDPERR